MVDVEIQYQRAGGVSTKKRLAVVLIVVHNGAMISVEERYKLAIEAGCHDRTVRRWLDGRPVHRVTAKALERAAKALGIEATPKGSAC